MGSMAQSRKHAIVIGASVGGSCAARALSDFYDRVTVYEHDELPAAPGVADSARPRDRQRDAGARGGRGAGVRRPPGHRVRTADGATADADLVVDAAGRGTRLPVWLAQWGFDRPREEAVDVDISYATHRVRIPDGLIDEKLLVAGASSDQPVGLGMLYYEDAK